ncbi:Peptidoglycan/xylan/chitin deacetylase, PgdA/CDA1 family [Selenomonas sp. GACV-9]|uniref:polysaccharide deacetylase family protein n=1 Tax=Selenomonas sp. GACV-9 TaxID=3158782 RepID=UPI0008EA7912|nr:Peptidoglycan/xylan/chitin deacetylase, PgdA/CDA1 family [Selenomonas ruminantium]
MTRQILSILTLSLALLLAGCGSSTPATDTSTPQKAADTTEPVTAPACILADSGLANLQLDTPSLPVYDQYTIAERRAKNLPTQLPQLQPYKEGKVAYLTFDDGPDDKNTPAILDILRENDVPATFYVTGAHAELHPDVLKRIFDEHHAIGNHSYDHDYKKLYPSVDGFLAEMQKTDDIIKNIIGFRPLILRAPGGVVGHFTEAYRTALTANGYVEHDWNVSSADAAPGHPTAQDFIGNIDSQTDNKDFAIILMHSSEGHEETVKALPEIIRILKAKGFTFGVITPMTPQPW